MEALWITLAVLGSLCVLLCMLYLLVLIRPRRAKGMDRLLVDYAHRGLFDGAIPENSLPAFDAAAREGFGIELDVQLSRDGEVMVFHDATLVRMTGDERKLSELTVAELKELRLQGGEERIPTFREVLALVDGRVPLLVELKGENYDTSLCPKVAALLREYRGPYCVESFNPLLLRGIGRELPEVPRGLLYTNVCRDKKRRSLLNLALTGMLLNVLASPSFIAYNKKDRDSFPVRITTRWFRAPRFVWTVQAEDARVEGECNIFERHF